VAVVLVVENDSMLRDMVCRHLGRRGHTPLSAGTGAEALARGARRSPTVALLELRLQDIDGLSLFMRLRRDHPNLIGLIVTAFGSVPSAVACLHAGISEHLEKPFEIDALGALVERLAQPARSLAPTVATHILVVPAHQRLAIAMTCGLDDLRSITSFSTWGHTPGAAESTLRMWCEAAHVPPRAALDFRRGLVAVILGRKLGAQPQDLLGFLDLRSIERFLLRCGPLQAGGQPWTAAEFCRRQRVLTQTAVVAEVMRLLALRGLLN